MKTAPEKFAAVQEELRSVSKAELAERFSYARTSCLVKVDEIVPAQEQLYAEESRKNKSRSGFRSGFCLPLLNEEV